ncbi:MAG: hypothetical protein ATN35_08430 [Epulopiscium sp. Nele67-Bin004]|nr:MAG: hypothetical protein ATN35_08430 [Epulopiscium sp. Nele67-Bin004]
MRNRNLKLCAVLMVTTVGATVFTGCSSSDSGSSNATTQQSTSTPSTTPTETETPAETTQVEEKEVELTLANGTFDFKFADTELRHTFMAAAEDYLLHNQYGGVPLYSNAGYGMFSSRYQTALADYDPAMGFGNLYGYGTMTADDSTVLMDDGQPGNAGEYTYRASVTTNPATWNQWQYENANESELMTFFYGALYQYAPNASKTGYDLAPSMAVGDPIPVDAFESESGKEVAYTWQIKIQEGLEWSFHPDTDTSMITDTTIDANDFYETYKIALENGWFRATSGGSDFCTGSGQIVNAQAFVDGMADWEDVGFEVIDDYTLQLTFVEQQSAWTVKYSMGSFVKSPIQLEMYAALGDSYGNSEKNVAYSGPYYVNYYESDKVVRMKKAENNIHADQYFATGINYSVISDQEMRFQEYVAGKLDYSPLPTTQYDEYQSHPGLRLIPGTTTFRMMLNGTGTIENQTSIFPDSSWTPEPILANQDFKMALYHSIDRNKLAKEVMKTVEPNMYLFSEAYVVDAEIGTPYRTTEQGQAVGSDLSPSTHGYNVEAAKAYFNSAIDQLVADGVYSNGDTITLEFYYFSGSESQALLGDYIKEAIESIAYNEEHNIKVVIDSMPKDFPGIYNDHMQIGEFDMSIGGISGSRLDAASFLKQFTDDNRGGFTLNWGIDTNVPEIEVEYVNYDGETVRELWSFNAIYSALNGVVNVVDGQEVQ